MTIFDVPGWSVPSNPVQEDSTTPSKKRKRHSNERQSLEVNFDKIMEKWKGTVGGEEKKNEPKTKSPKNKNKKYKQGDKSKSDPTPIGTKTISRPKPLKALAPTTDGDSRPMKKAKTAHEPARSSSIASSLTLAPPSSTTAPKLTKLQQGMKSSLDGAKFRMINETLYRSNSHEARRLVQEDPKIFEEYHQGFRHQVESWPTNPVQYYISTLSSYPPRTVIADLGCGDAALARSLVHKGLNVLSYDLKTDGEYVIEADVFDRIPLPGHEGEGKEKTHGIAQVVDVVICALSLMGTNWPGCLREAWRILKPEGELKIAEVASRFTNVEEFLSLVGSIGFRFKFKDETNTHFTLFEFKKIARKPKSDLEWERIMSRGRVLKPCEYKRR